jgi:hypothetical protein
MRHLLFALFLLSLAGPAQARTVELSGGVSTVFAPSGSMGPFGATDPVASPVSDFGFALELTDLPWFDDLWLEARVAFSGKSGTAFGDMHATLFTHTYQVGARAVKSVRPWLRAYVHLDAGPTWGELTLRERAPSGETPVADSAFAVSLLGGVGLDLGPQRRRSSGLVAAFRVELAYQQTTPLAFQAQPSYPDDGIQRIETASAPLGSVDPSGLVLRFAAVFSF